VAKIRLTLSCGDYDRTRPLIDGAVSAPGLKLQLIPLPSAERHTRFVRNLEFDVCELQIAQYLGLRSRGFPITAIPVFPHRRFNHSCVMVRMDSTIKHPEDLRGRRVGVHGHFNPIALWIRGLLQHEFDLPPSEIHWIADGAEDVPGWSPPSWLRIERAPAGRKMQDLLKAGELDAQILSDSGADASMVNKVVRRLWPNYREVEVDYYRRTGIFRFAISSSSRMKYSNAIPMWLYSWCALSKMPSSTPINTGPTTAARLWRGSAPSKRRSERCSALTRGPTPWIKIR
jgi:4,5-dihydroxyphthalate decarboxylase